MILDVSSNQLSGALPFSFADVSSLIHLYAHGNSFNIESNPLKALPSSIEHLSLSLNHRQTISETVFHNLAKLSQLSLSNCVLNISATWIPLFQLDVLFLTSCDLDGRIPPWISTQYSLSILTLADNNLVGEIPSWIWKFSPHLIYLNLSQNYLQGSIFPKALNGYISSVRPPPLEVLILNDNLLAGNIPPGLGNFTDLRLLNLANNNLSGVIPPSLGNIPRLAVLDLGGNSLEGSIPKGICPMSFVVHNNRLSGKFPGSIINCTKIITIDMGDNTFTGPIPNSIGNLSALQVLVMKSNYFSSIPSDIGKLNKLHILDISSNNLSGFLPHSIISLQAITLATDIGFMSSIIVSGSGSGSGSVSLHFEHLTYHDQVDLTAKGVDLHYLYILSTLSVIDLSNNQLNGVFPSDFGKLKGLRFLNLSMNNFSGLIPRSLGEMTSLESLDLSRNMFFGNIPQEFLSLHSLGFLNLSNNNLSGMIPQGRQMATFDQSSYLQNLNLSGCPLPKHCSRPQFSPPPTSTDDEDDGEENSKQKPWYEVGLILSYGVGFGGVVFLIVVRESWKQKYFKRVDMILKFLFPFIRNRRL